MHSRACVVEVAAYSMGLSTRPALQLRGQRATLHRPTGWPGRATACGAGFATVGRPFCRRRDGVGRIRVLELDAIHRGAGDPCNMRTQRATFNVQHNAFWNSMPSTGAQGRCLRSVARASGEMHRHAHTFTAHCDSPSCSHPHTRAHACKLHTHTRMLARAHTHARDLSSLAWHAAHPPPLSH